MKNIFNKLLWLIRIVTIVLAIFYLKKDNHLIYVMLIVSLTTWYHLEMRNFIGNYIGPRIKINQNSSWFHQTDFEKKLDTKLKVKKWKKYIPSYNPNEFDIKRTSVTQIIANMYRAEIDHEIMFILSYVPLIFSIFFDDFIIFLLTSVIVSLIDLALVIVQRYNRNRLTKISSKIVNRKH